VYTRLFGRPPDNHPMTTLVEWKVVEFGWVQVFCDPSRAGSALLNLAVRDLAVHIAELEGRELSPGPVVAADKGVTLSSIEDPTATGSPSSATSVMSIDDGRPAQRAEVPPVGSMRAQP